MKTILIVEDNPINQRLFFDVLQAYGAHPIKAFDAKEALRILTQTTPDLILMDIQLPHISGIDLVKHIRALPRFKHLPIIATTAFAFEGKKEELLQQGFDDVLFKPIDIHALKKLCE